MKMITQSELKELLEYNLETGIFTWKINKWRVFKGMKAGTLQNTGYILIRIGRKGYSAHRLAFLYVNGEFPKGQVDHINHNVSDNVFSNLRIVSSSENMKNKSLYKNNLSGQVGVYFSKGANKYVAEININGKKKYLGSFDDVNDAIDARKKAQINENYHINHGDKQ